MLAATKVKMSGNEKRVNRSPNISSIKRVNRKLKEVSRFSRAKQGRGNVQKCAARVQLFLANEKKKCAARFKLFLAN